MNHSNDQLKNFYKFLIRIIVCMVLGIFTCQLFNFMLVSPVETSRVGTAFADYHKNGEDAEVLFFGSSRFARGIDTPSLSEKLGKKCFSIVSDNVNYCTLYHLFKETCKTSQPKLVFLEYSIANFKREKANDELYVYNLLTGETKEEYAKACNLSFQSSKLLEFTDYIENFSNDKFVYNIRYKLDNNKTAGSGIDLKDSKYVGNGFSYTTFPESNDNNLVITNEYLTNGNLWDEKDVNTDSLNYFYKFLDYAKEKEIKVVLLQTPFPYVVSRANQEDFDRFEESLQNYIKEYSDVEIIDLSKLKNFKFVSSLFPDATHLTGKGAQTICQTLKDVCEDLLEGNFDKNKYFYKNYYETVNAYID